MSAALDNLDILRKVKTEQPEFWAHLRNISAGLKESGNYYWDNHSRGKLSSGAITHLVVVQRTDENGILLPDERYRELDGEPYNTHAHPIAWVTPFRGASNPDLSPIQCMNNLYIRKDKQPKVALTTYSTGTMIEREAFKKLIAGETVIYTRKFNEVEYPSEMQYAITIEGFHQVLSE